MTLTLEPVRKLVVMNNDQLTGQFALGLMNDMVTNAMAAFVGEPNDTTGGTIGGINWIEGQLQRLAVIPIVPVQRP